ncbi:MAG: SPASM domain-containing protein [Magnetococcales bacterium]|nr:SPASM domain-containing protein [Magnetococcales bacterium]
MGRGPTTIYHQSLNDNYVKGTLTCLRPEVIQQRIHTGFPLVLNIEPTNACNARCHYCPREMTVQSQGTHYLDLEDFKRVIDQIPQKLIMLNLHKDGEPLLHRDLPAMVAYARKKDAAEVVHLNTNGIPLHSRVGRGIIEQGIDDITISVDAASEASYRRFKRVKGLSRLEGHIRDTIDYRNRLNSPTHIRVKIMEFDQCPPEEIELFRERWTGVADEVQVTGVHSWSGAIDLRVTDETTPQRYPCALLWYMLAVNSNGQVSICNVDWNYSGVVGSIHTQSVAEIWNGPRLRMIRNNHLQAIWNNPQVCEKCVVWVSVGNMRNFLQDQEKFLP